MLQLSVEKYKHSPHLHYHDHEFQNNQDSDVLTPTWAANGFFYNAAEWMGGAVKGMVDSELAPVMPQFPAYNGNTPR